MKILLFFGLLMLLSVTAEEQKAIQAEDSKAEESPSATDKKDDKTNAKRGLFDLGDHFGFDNGFDLHGFGDLHHDHHVKTVTITKHVPVPAPYPVHVEKHVPYPVKVPIKVPVDRPYPVHVPAPYPVTVEKHIPVPVEKPVPYPVKVPIKVPVKVPYPVKVPIKVPVEIHKHVAYPVKVPVVVKEPYPVYLKDHHHDYVHHGFGDFGFGHGFH